MWTPQRTEKSFAFAGNEPQTFGCPGQPTAQSLYLMSSPNNKERFFTFGCHYNIIIISTYVNPFKLISDKLNDYAKFL
jgi:hypothetical protein